MWRLLQHHGSEEQSTAIRLAGGGSGARDGLFYVDNDSDSDEHILIAELKLRV